MSMSVHEAVSRVVSEDFANLVIDKSDNTPLFAFIFLMGFTVYILVIIIRGFIKIA